MHFRVLLLLTALGCAPNVAHAQTPPPKPPPETHLYLGMWTTHLNADKPAIDPNWLVAVSHGHVFGGTFTNSFGKRGYTAGFQQRLVQAGSGVVRSD